MTRRRRVLREVMRTSGSGYFRRDGREYVRYHFKCGHAQDNLRMDGIITAFLVAVAQQGRIADYPLRKCYKCTAIAEEE